MDIEFSGYLGDLALAGQSLQQQREILLTARDKSRLGSLRQCTPTRRQRAIVDALDRVETALEATRPKIGRHTSPLPLLNLVTRQYTGVKLA